MLPRELRRAKRRWQRDVDALDDAEDAGRPAARGPQEGQARALRRRGGRAGARQASPRSWRRGWRSCKTCSGATRTASSPARVLEGLADDARAAGEDTFTYGRLHAIEQRAAADAAAEGRALLDWCRPPPRATREHGGMLAQDSGPTSVPLLEETIGANLARTVAAHGDREALVARHQGVRWTYTEFAERVDRLARGLLGPRAGAG